MANVMITGSTGFLGRNMLKWFLQHTQHDIYALVRPRSVSRLAFAENQRVHAVVSELGDLKADIVGLPREWEAFYHFAWGGVNRNEIDDETVQHANVERALRCAELAKELGCAVFVNAGSRAEYGMPEGFFSEEVECKPVSAYGRAKLRFYEQAEELLRKSATQLIHARIFSVYGSDDHPWSLIHSSVMKMLHNEPVSLGPCTQLWNFMEIEDACDLLATFWQRRDRIPADCKPVFNVATRDIRPLRKFVEEIYMLTHSRSELHFGTFRQASGSDFSIVPDMDKVERVFNWKPKVDFRTGIQRMITEMEGKNA